MDSCVHRWEYFVLNCFCRLVGFLLRESVVFCFTSFLFCLFCSLYKSYVLLCVFLPFNTFSYLSKKEKMFYSSLDICDICTFYFYFIVNG